MTETNSLAQTSKLELWQKIILDICIDVIWGFLSNNQAYITFCAFLLHTLICTPILRFFDNCCEDLNKILQILHVTNTC